MHASIGDHVFLVPSLNLYDRVYSVQYPLNNIMSVNGICQTQVYYIGNIVRINNGNCASEFTFKKVE